MAKADLISIVCMRGIVSYHHYGIDIGDGTVVHLATGSDRQTMSVQRVSVEEFAKGADVSVEVVTDELAPDEVIERSLAAVGNVGYDLMIGNCEHFARKMKTGKGQSHQVDMCVSSIVRAAFSGFASASRKYGIAGSLAGLSQSKVLIAAGSLVPTVVGETARNGSYYAARKLKMTHEEADRSSRSVGHAACAIGGFVVGGPAGSAGALAISLAADRLSDAIQKKFFSRD
ncbi:MAG: lecithin retinol acyltransferase family protein [Planctomycetota bacterium]|nr:lecithin retinol acyltransferase family protein [Planctomycetota bacterium]